MIKFYSNLEIKALDEERRFISGMATSPTPDRVGDIVEPLGATFAKEIPLKWMHKTGTPNIGQVRLGRPTKEGIPFDAQLIKFDEPGQLKELLDFAWHSVKSRAVNSVSIGFRTLSDGVERIKDGGLRFLKTEILELSLVDIPANQDATIEVVKAFETEYIKQVDQAQLRAASGTARGVRLTSNSPGASGTTDTASRGFVKLIPRKRP